MDIGEGELEMEGDELLHEWRRRRAEIELI